VITRLERLQSHLRSEVTTLFERFGLTDPAFAVIATLRRAGKPLLKSVTILSKIELSTQSQENSFEL
jgi:hypothetical protein